MTSGSQEAKSRICLTRNFIYVGLPFQGVAKTKHQAWRFGVEEMLASGGSHLQRDKPARRMCKVGHYRSKRAGFREPRGTPDFTQADYEELPSTFRG